MKFLKLLFFITILFTFVTACNEHKKEVAPTIIVKDKLQSKTTNAKQLDLSQSEMFLAYFQAIENITRISEANAISSNYLTEKLRLLSIYTNNKTDENLENVLKHIGFESLSQARYLVQNVQDKRGILLENYDFSLVLNPNELIDDAIGIVGDLQDQNEIESVRGYRRCARKALAVYESSIEGHPEREDSAWSQYIGSLNVCRDRHLK